jgi:hypothetical protein
VIEPTLMRLLLVIAAERLAVGAAQHLRNLGPSVARVRNDDPWLQAIAEQVPDEVTWKEIESEILSPDFRVPPHDDQTVYLQEVLSVVKRVLSRDPRSGRSA